MPPDSGASSAASANPSAGPSAGGGGTAAASSSGSSSAVPLSSPTAASTRLWSSHLSPSSTASSAASSAFERRPTRRRVPSFEEFRAQEPPQARLIRLRGLFDVLLDAPDASALADGRAKQEWHRSASRARLGAGGKYARGSMAPPGRADGELEDAAQLQQQSQGVSAPRQSYASELLDQCRACRAELEREHERERSECGDGWSAWIPFMGSSSAKEEQKKAEKSWAETFGISSSSSSASAASGSASSGIASASTSTPPEEGAAASKPDDAASTPSSSLLSRATSIFSSSSPQSDLGSDHEGEAGWVGSGVWGLSAVGAAQRDRDRERDRHVEMGKDVQDDGGRRQRMIEWEGFLRYSDIKERELYAIFTELDKNGDMHLDFAEIRTALVRAGIELPEAGLEDFVASMAASSRYQSARPESISFPQFRDYLLLLPRKPSVNEIYRFYQVRKAFGLFGAKGIFASFSENWGRAERHGATAVNLDGDVSLAGEERKKAGAGGASAGANASTSSSSTVATSGAGTGTGASKGAAPAAAGDAPVASKAAGEPASAEQPPSHEEEEEDSDMIHGDVAVKFLLAGGIAGAVSRTATAPFDRLKIYLITTGSSSSSSASPLKSVVGGPKSASMLGEAIRALYRDGGGLKSFWVGNGLNCVKIFPESAIKFLSYETSKRAFAKYVDGVADSRDISGVSRFVSGGIGGITSQLAIYPVETLKTRLMSSQSSSAPSSAPRLVGNALVRATARDMWAAGGIRTYYRGLTAGLIGVFPYSAIDMSTFEGIKLFYIRYTGKEEPGVLALLAFGSVSGSVGATTVYPLNLVRTRLQAAGTPAHPQTYTGFADVARRTYASEGVRGFYRGLVPTLAKVVPAVSISYVVYEHSKRHLGVQ